MDFSITDHQIVFGKNSCEKKAF